MNDIQFTIQNKTDRPLKVISSIPEATGPSVGVLLPDEKIQWFRQPSITSIVIEELTAEELLAKATADFEKMFSNVQIGEAKAYFYHVDGSTHEYIEVCSGGVKKEDAALECFDTAEEAIQSWWNALREFKARKYLYWRIKPEIYQDRNEKDLNGDFPNPTSGKWRVYSRFKALD